jgi:hypothetical protein
VAVTTGAAIRIHRVTNASRLDNQLIQKKIFVGLTDANPAGA